MSRLIETLSSNPAKRVTAKQILQESGDVAVKRKKGEVEPLQRTLVQYLKAGNAFRPTGDAILTDGLDPCAYEIKHDMQGLYFERVKPKTDEFMLFEQSPMFDVIAAVDKFWERKPQFEKLGLTHSRGAILFGEAGTGKSACLQQVVEKMVNRGDVVFFASTAESIVEGLSAFREVEPTRPVVVCFEEAEAVCSEHGGERTMLRLLDGDKKMGDVFYLATTNYLDRLSSRVKRFGRLDCHIYVGPPNKDIRQKYLEHKLNGTVDQATIKRLVEETKGMGFGHLRELIAGAFGMGEDLDVVLKKLKSRPITESKHDGTKCSCGKVIKRCKCGCKLHHVVKCGCAKCNKNESLMLNEDISKELKVPQGETPPQSNHGDKSKGAPTDRPKAKHFFNKGPRVNNFRHGSLGMRKLPREHDVADGKDPGFSDHGVSDGSAPRASLSAKHFSGKARPMAKSYRESSIASKAQRLVDALIEGSE